LTAAVAADVRIVDRIAEVGAELAAAATPSMAAAARAAGVIDAQPQWDRDWLATDFGTTRRRPRPWHATISTSLTPRKCSTAIASAQGRIGERLVRSTRPARRASPTARRLRARGAARRFKFFTCDTASHGGLTESRPTRAAERLPRWAASAGSRGGPAILAQPRRADAARAPLVRMRQRGQSLEQRASVRDL